MQTGRRCDLRAAEAYDCVDVVLADIADVYRGIDGWAGRRLAMAASKSGRWVGEMREAARDRPLAAVLAELRRE